MISSCRRASGLWPLAVLAPILMGGECTLPVSVGTPFSSIEFESYGGCGGELPPARAVVRRLEDGMYELEISEFGMPDGNMTDSAACFDAHGYITEEGCALPEEGTTRLLSAEEMQRVDDVVQSLEAELYVPFVDFYCSVSVCGYTNRWINGVKYEATPCGPGPWLILLWESAERFDALIAELRN